MNPFAKKKAELIAAAAKKANDNSKKALAAKRKNKDEKKAKKARNAKWNDLQTGLKASFKAAEDKLEEEARAGNYVPGDTSEEDD